MGQRKVVGCCCFGAGNNSLSTLLVHLLYARLCARASNGTHEIFTTSLRLVDLPPLFYR